MVQRVCILGATGSVGGSTLDVMALHPGRYQVLALTAFQKVDALAALCLQWRPRFAAVGTPAQADALRAQLLAAGVRTEVLHGPQALCDLAAHPDVDSVMAAIVGAAGLPACLAAARAGKRLMLANKEALVVGGRLFMQAVQQGGALLLPIDSEHSAIFQCLPEDRRTWAERIQHIVLTASGGPFRTRDPATLHTVTPDEACAHPNWVMGRKISVDSATMMNKALEVIEARWLFDLAPEQVRVVLHPQSIIHSMVVCRDNSVLAQLGTPDMKVPISVGLAWPGREASGADALDFLSCKPLTFEPADHGRFPGLGLAYDALRAPDGSTTVLNAANEVAVAAFLAGRVRFTDIHRINAEAVAGLLPTPADAASLDDLLALDQRARRHAQANAQELTR
ncbi:MAG: 1-deoxy-D-xylulose-5-phosphate reductoisomerase [Burkholderiaceae bacterium]|jgi:1-deoxy-D-xylulose-5-phosphate reductoisomerase|nr:1-deoxy-D-xylulose-5-phosphate reductoisomerase [Burkholderiaceae bacterium]